MSAFLPKSAFLSLVVKHPIEPAYETEPMPCVTLSATKCNILDYSVKEITY